MKNLVAFCAASAAAALLSAQAATTTALPPGAELDYAEITSNVLVSHNETDADTVITGHPLTFDGSTRVEVQFFAQVVETPRTGYDFNLGLCENGSLVRLLVGRYLATGSTLGGVLDIEANGFAFFTPTAGEHTYTICAYKSPGSVGSAIVAAGDGVGDNFPPAFYRITQA